MTKSKIIAVACLAIFGISATVVNNDKYFEMIKNIEIFTNVYKELNTHYVDEIDPAQLMRTGIDAMVASLDPYTNYYSESQVQSYRISSEGRYNGIGAVSKVIDDWVTITQIIEDGPAHKAGVKVGDQIRAINGDSTKDRSNADVVQIVRGFPGSTLGLTIRSAGAVTDRKVDLDRSEVQLKNVPFSGYVADGIGYVNLTTFTANATKNIAKSIKEMKKDDQELNGIILDLRNNGGGLLREAVGICNLFLPAGREVVSTKGKVKDRDKVYKTKAQPLDEEVPLVILINKSSASASEIVSGVIQDFDRGVLMGQRSFGKGLVQNHREVGYNSRIKVTTSKYYIPSGRCIQSVEYENGEPKDIDDTKRATFQTANGRPVLDGGGVAPDVELDLPEKSELLKVLAKQDWIFKFVNDYVSDIDSLENAKDYRFTDFDQFRAYLTKNEFEFTTKAEKELQEFKEELDDEAMDSQIASIENAIILEKSDDLEEYKSELIRAIEEEIVSRYFFESGRTELNLDQDSEIKKAIDMLKDKARYDQVLAGSI